jgi:NADH-quinone oxidoreductase subunit L
MAIGCLNLAGFPGSAGFFSKDMILAEAFTTPGFAAIGWLLLITAGLTAYYTFRVFFRVFVGPVDYQPGEEAHGHDEHTHGEHGHDAHGKPGRGAPRQGTPHGTQHTFHPHPPQWAINTVLAILAVSSVAVAGVYIVNGDHGWVGGMVHGSTAGFESPFGHQEAAGEHAAAEAAHAGTFLGWNPHKAMYFVSGGIGLIGIGCAFWLHYAGRKTAATARADRLLPAFGPIARWAQRKWYVDELYDFLFVQPLWVVSHIFHIIDKLLVDGLVNVFGLLPRGLAWALRPSQSGLLHGYAVGMAGGVAVLLLIVLIVVA